MRRVIPALAVMLMVSVLALAQATPTPVPAPTKPIPRSAPASTVSDNTDMQATMNRIASDKALRTQMVQSLINVARTDADFRHEMVGAMMADKDMHMTMSHMQGGEKPAAKKYEGGKEGTYNEKKTTTSSKSNTPSPTPGK